MFNTGVQVLQGLTIVTLLVITGAALSLAVWVIPIVLMAPTSLAKTTQFCHAVELGGRYLQTSSRTCAASVLLLLLLSLRLESSAMLSTTTYAHALFWLLFIGVYEVYCVFPVNYEQDDRRVELQAMKKHDFGDRRDAKIDDNLRLWRFRHIPRILAPLIAVAVLTIGE